MRREIEKRRLEIGESKVNEQDEEEEVPDPEDNEQDEGRRIRIGVEVGYHGRTGKVVRYDRGCYDVYFSDIDDVEVIEEDELREQDPAAFFESKVNEQDEEEEVPAPEDVKLEPDADEAALEITKEYLGKTEDAHFYIVSTEEPVDLQIVDQEGVMKYSAKDNNLELTDVPGFIIQAIQDVEIDAIERSIFVKYILPMVLEEEPEAEKVPEVGAEEEEGMEAGVPKESKTNEKKKPPVCKKCGTKHWPFEPCPTGKKKAKKEEGKVPADKDSEEVKIKKLTEIIVTDDENNSFDVDLVDDGTIDTVIEINGQEFRFSPEFAKYWRYPEGELTEEGLEELTLDALSNLEEDEYNELVTRRKEIEVSPLETEDADKAVESKITEKDVKDMSDEELQKILDHLEKVTRIGFNVIDRVEEIKDELSSRSTEKTNEDYRQIKPGEYEVVFYDGTKETITAESAVDAMEKAKETSREKRVLNVKLLKQTDATKDVQEQREISQTKDIHGRLITKGDEVITSDAAPVQGIVTAVWDDGCVDIEYGSGPGGLLSDTFDIKGHGVTKVKESKENDEENNTPPKFVIKSKGADRYEVVASIGDKEKVVMSSVTSEELEKIFGRGWNRLVVESKTNESDKKKPAVKARQRGDCVFPAGSSKVTDDKDHFPINNANQARNALARANQYSLAPKWYKGSLESLVKKVASVVSKKYPSIDVSKAAKKPGKESKKDGIGESLDEKKHVDRLNKLLGL